MFAVTSSSTTDTGRLFRKEKLEFPGSNARLGRLETPHGTVETPAFMPVATKGSVKLLGGPELGDLEVQALITNAFLLSLRPGRELLETCGGIHAFMNWKQPLFADSGGFQMIRQGFLQKIDDQGVYFRSPYDGKATMLSPEDVVDINTSLGSDIAMMLDHVPGAGVEEEKVADALRRSLLWAERGLGHFRQRQEEGAGAPGQQFFCITQGGIHPELRSHCIQELNRNDFDGYGIGGLCIGEEKADMFRMVGLSDALIPKEKIRYLMGVGRPVDVIRSVALGMDIFDSVFPTRNARHKSFFTREGSFNIRTSRFARDFGPLEEDCRCASCRNFSRAYLHHLCRSEEYVWMRHLTVHNIHFMMRLMRDIRQAIREDSFLELAQSYGAI